MAEGLFGEMGCIFDLTRPCTNHSIRWKYGDKDFAGLDLMILFVGAFMDCATCEDSFYPMMQNKTMFPEPEKQPRQKHIWRNLILSCQKLLWWGFRDAWC